VRIGESAEGDVAEANKLVRGKKQKVNAMRVQKGKSQGSLAVASESRFNFTSTQRKDAR